MISRNIITDPESQVDITLYAIWTENSYTINFDGNNATGGKSLSSIHATFTQKIKLPANTYERSGYDFAGWSLNDPDLPFDDSKKIVDEAEVSGLTDEPNGVVTLFALWEPRNDTKFTVEVYFQDFDGNFNLDNSRAITFKISSTFEEFNEKIEKLSKEGNVFIGQSRTESIMTITATDEDYEH